MKISTTMGIAAVLGALLTLAAAFAGSACAADAAKDPTFEIRMRGLYVIPDETVSNAHGLGGVNVMADFTPEFDIEYFFTKNLTAELIAGVSKHEIRLGGDSIGSVWLLPPTLTAKWHFLPDGAVDPYAGFGINYTFPFSEKLNASTAKALGAKTFGLSPSVGWAAQAGVDFKIKDHLYFNTDFKYIEMDTNIKINGVKSSLDINPYIVGIGLGYRF